MRNVQQIKVIKFVKMLVITALLTLPVLMRAQGPVDPPPSDPPPVDGDPGAPIDGGLTLLLAAGAAYGVKKYRDNQKKNIPGEPAGENETGGLK